MKASEIYEHLKYIREILLKAKSQFCNIKKTFKVNAPNILLKSYTKLLSKIGESINVYKKKNALQDWKPNQQHLSFGVCELEFSFKQAETMLNTLIKVTDSFQTRATSLIAVLVPIFLSVAGLAAINFNKNMSYFYPLSIVGTMVLYSLINCLRIITTRQSLRDGSEPKLLLNPIFLKGKWRKEDVMKHMLLSECSSYQSRIDERDELNKKLGQYLKLCIRSMICAPLAGIIFYAACIFLHIPTFPN